MGCILLVDDDPDVRLLLEHVLYDAGHSADAVETAAEARAMLGARRYDLVVADALLNDASGLTVADKAHEVGTRSLIITGYAIRLEADLERYDYLLKPIKPTEFVREVERRLPSSSR
jgi:DNA-binding NtrC family response regulator